MKNKAIDYITIDETCEAIVIKKIAVHRLLGGYKMAEWFELLSFLSRGLYPLAG